MKRVEFLSFRKNNRVHLQMDFNVSTERRQVYRICKLNTTMRLEMGTSFSQTP